MLHRRAAILAAALLTGLFAVPALAEEAISYKTLVTPLLETSQTVIGQPIVYPAGTAKVTAVIVTIPPGGETGWHEHAVPLFGYMLDGALTVDYGDKGTRTYNVGDTLMEAMNWPHNGANKGDVPVRILAVYMGADGIPNATAVPK
jgi:quercetin dioxygenase-like cupin family protein